MDQGTVISSPSSLYLLCAIDRYSSSFARPSSSFGSGGGGGTSFSSGSSTRTASGFGGTRRR